MRKRVAWLLGLSLVSAAARIAAEPICEAGVVPENTVRFASFNVHLYRDTPGQLLADLSAADDQLEADASDRQIRAVAEIIQRVRPDVLLLNEFDYDRNRADTATTAPCRIGRETDRSP